MTDPRRPEPEEGTAATQDIHVRQPPQQQEGWWSEPGADTQVWTEPSAEPPRPPRAEQPPRRPAPPPDWAPPADLPRDQRPPMPPRPEPRPEPPRGYDDRRPEPPYGYEELQPEPPRGYEDRRPEPPRDPRRYQEPGDPRGYAAPEDPRGYAEPGDLRGYAEHPPPVPPRPAPPRPPRPEPTHEAPMAADRPPMRPPAPPRPEAQRPDPAWSDAPQAESPRGHDDRAFDDRAFDDRAFDDRGYDDRRPEPPRPDHPRGQRPPLPDANERTQLIQPIREDAPVPPRAAPPPAPEELTTPIPRIPSRPRLDEQETELIPRVDDYVEDYDYGDPEPDPEPEPEPEIPEQRRREPGRAVVRTFGELLITAGLVVLLFVVYEVYVTDWLSAGKQANATSALDDRWKNPNVVTNNEQQRTNQFQVGDGEGFAKVYIPAFGSDWVYTVLEGTTDKILEAGPGHYKNTAYPGEQGNFAVAGHRVGKGAPFNDIDLLESCDAIVVETQTDWFVYRMLPKAEEVKDWAKNKGADAKCKGVAPQGKGGKNDPYAKTVGQEIVRPEQGEVIAAVPWAAANAVPKNQQSRLITLTTCHPRFSARQRLIVHGVLVRTQPKDPKDPKAVPAEFQTG